nr:Tetracycline_Resistance_MFS_Efflux_Pump [uncultured bacterium]
MRSASLLFIFVTIAIDAIGMGIIIPVLPDVIRRFLSDEAAISRVYGYFIAVYALMQLVSSPLLGALSDRFGRRPVLLVSLLGAAVDYFFMALAPTLPLLFLGRIISGVSGASFTVASAYIADISNDENRSKNFGVMGAGFGLGFILGPAIGGLLAAYGPQYPFLAAGAFNLLNFLYGAFVLPESLGTHQRRAVQWRSLNPLRSLHALSKMPAIRALVLVHVLIQLAGQTHPSIWTLYTEHRYGWSASEVGLSLAFVGVLSALSQGLLTGVIVKRFGERKVLTMGCLGEALSFTLFGLAVNGTMLYLVLLFSSVFWAAHPALQSLVSREVPPSEQGELQGSLMSLTSLMSILNPLIMTTLFAAFSVRGTGHYVPGAPYLLAGALYLAAWGMAARWERKHPEHG